MDMMQTDNTQPSDAQMSDFPIFQTEIDLDRIAVVRIGNDENAENWLPSTLAEQLRAVIGSVIYQQARGVIFISAKPRHFIQGMRPSVLHEKDPQSLRVFSADLQAAFRELNQLKVPVLAAIHGHCFGVGLELALACDYRLASEAPETQFALPQVRSGILPFAGGTQRLPRLIGLHNAAPLILRGNKVSVGYAQKVGLIHQAVPENRLLDTARRLLLDNAVQKADPKQPLGRLSRWRKQLEGNPFYRNWLCARLENSSWQETFGNSPSRDHLLQLLKAPRFKEGLQLEQQALATLLHTEQAQVLMNLKRTEQAMKSQYQHRANVRDVQQLSILGSGYMGAGIAYLTANNAQIPVRIKDIHPLGIQKALRNCYELMQQAVAEKRLPYGKIVQRMNLISGGERLVAAQSTDFIIEAVYEDLALKQQMVRESEQYYDAHAIFASNTSTLSIGEIASVAERPENVIGFHYFSPVTERKMVEIIPHSKTSEHTIATAIHFAIQQGKIPLLVSDTQGFFINRILIPYLQEALYCLVDGESIEFIDRSLQEFGFQIGPLAMIDNIGLDVLSKSSSALKQEFGSRFAQSEKIALLSKNERKGVKNHRGFYLYDSKHQRTQEDKSIYHVMEVISHNDLEAEEIARRCILRMINEAGWCLQDHVIATKDEGNVASVLGFGFPDFRGGIYAYIDKIGAKEIVRQLQLHCEKYDNRFAPCEWLLKQAENE